MKENASRILNFF